ncbi:12409_t:CDS:10 [Entrophospora sp. SA101]|nr:12409_t:CDS:10 [Entrophospora sp. SA101]
MAYSNSSKPLTTSNETPKDYEVPQSPPDGISSVTFSPQADYFAVTSWDNHVRIYEANQQAGTTEGKAYHLHEKPVLCSAWSNDGTKVFSGGADCAGRMFDITTQTATQIAQHVQPIRCIECVDANNIVVTGGWDKTLKVYWDLRSPQPVLNVNLPERVYAMDLHYPHLVVGTADRNVIYYNLTNPNFSTLKWQTRCVACYVQPIRCIECVDANNIVVTGGWDKTLKVYWDLRSPQPVLNVNLPERVYAMDLHYPHLVVGTADRNVIYYNLTNPNFSTLKWQTRCVACYPAGNGYAIGSIEGRVGIQYFDEKDQRQGFSFKCHRDGNNIYAVNAISFHPLYGTFSTSGSDGSFSFWDKESKQRIKGFNTVGAPIIATDFNRNGTLFAYAVSYDWSKGYLQYPQLPTKNAIFLRAISDDDVKPKKSTKTIKNVETNNSDLRIIKGVNYQDGTILLRLLNPLNYCNENTIYLRLVHTNGTVSTLNLNNLNIPKDNFCDQPTFVAYHKLGDNNNNDHTSTAKSTCSKKNPQCSTLPATVEPQTTAITATPTTTDAANTPTTTNNNPNNPTTSQTPNPTNNNTITTSPDGSVDRITIHAISFKYILINYFCDRSVSNKVCGDVVTWTGELVSKIEFENICDDSRIVQSHKKNVGFLRACYLKDTKEIVWTKYTTPNVPTGTIFQVSTGKITNVINFNSNVTNFFSTEDGEYAMVTCTSKTTTITNNQFTDDWTISVTFLPKDNGSPLTGPFELYKSKTTGSGLVDIVNIRRCDLAYYSSGYSCLISIFRSTTTKISFIDVDFLSSGKVNSVTPEFSITQITTATIWDVQTLYYGGYVILVETPAGSVEGHVCSNNGTYFGNWGFTKQYEYTNKIAGVLPNNTLWTIPKQQLDDNNSWTCVLTDTLTTYSTVQNTNSNVNTFPGGPGGYGSDSILSTTPEKNSNIISTDINLITITYTKSIKTSSGKINIYQKRSSTSPNIDDDDKDILRQSCFAQSDYVQISNETTAQVKVLKSTFNNPGSEYYVTVEDDFVKSATTDQNIIGINSKAWNFSTVLVKDESYVNYDSDSVSCIIRLTPEGTTYYTSLSTDDQTDFVGKISNELSNALPCDVTRVTTLTKYQYSLHNNNINNDNLSQKVFKNVGMNITASSTDQIFMRVEIEGTLSRTELSAVQLASDLNELILNKDVTLLSKGLYTNLIDSGYGAERLDHFKEKFRWIFMIIFIGFLLLMLIILWILIRMHKYKAAQRFLAAVMFTFIISDFCLNIVFISIHGKDFKWLYPLSITFLVVPIEVTESSEKRTSTFSSKASITSSSSSSSGKSLIPIVNDIVSRIFDNSSNNTHVNVKYMYNSIDLEIDSYCAWRSMVGTGGSDRDEYDDRKSIIDSSSSKYMKGKNVGSDISGVNNTNRKKKNFNISRNNSIKEIADDDTNSTTSNNSNDCYNSISSVDKKKKRRNRGSKEDEEKYVSLFDDDYKKPARVRSIKEKNNTTKADLDVVDVAKDPFNETESMTTVANNINTNNDESKKEKVDDKSESLEISNSTLIEVANATTTASNITTDTKAATSKASSANKKKDSVYEAIKNFEETLTFDNLTASNGSNDNKNNIDTAANIDSTATASSNIGKDEKSTLSPLPKTLSSKANSYESIISNYAKGGELLVSVTDVDIDTNNKSSSNNNSAQEIENVQNVSSKNEVVVVDEISDYGELNKTPTIVINNNEISQGETAAIYNKDTSGILASDEVGTSLTEIVEPLSLSPLSSTFASDISSHDINLSPSCDTDASAHNNDINL